MDTTGNLSKSGIAKDTDLTESVLTSAKSQFSLTFAGTTYVFGITQTDADDVSYTNAFGTKSGGADSAFTITPKVDGTLTLKVSTSNNDRSQFGKEDTLKLDIDGTTATDGTWTFEKSKNVIVTITKSVKANKAYKFYITDKNRLNLYAISLK